MAESMALGLGQQFRRTNAGCKLLPMGIENHADRVGFGDCVNHPYRGHPVCLLDGTRKD